MSSSWKLESSHTTHASGSERPGSSLSARPTLPATSTSRPCSRSIAPISSVVVVLPFVPVTPTIGFGSIRAASSTSLHTGTPAARAAATGGALDGHSRALDHGGHALQRQRFISQQDFDTRGAKPRRVDVRGTVGGDDLCARPHSQDRLARGHARAAQPDDQVALTAHRKLE